MHPTPYPVWRAPTGAAVVTMPGQIDDADCGQVHAALMRALQSGATVIVADLTGTRSCSYSAAETLVSAQARAAGAGARVKVAATAGKALLIGQVAGAGHQLDFYPDLDAALAGPRARQRRPGAGPRRAAASDSAAEGGRARHSRNHQPAAASS
jgi:anti-anti-sigma regulatory factor